MKPTRYTPLDSQASDSSFEQPRYQPTFLRRRVQVQSWYFWASLLWNILSTFVVLSLGYLFHQKLYQCHVNGGFLNGFKTELEPAKSTIQPVQISFTGGLHYDEQGHLFREVIENEPQYVGPPSPEIDAAWDDLLKGQYINLEGDESTSIKGRTWQDKTGKYEVALDVMHTLHCVNQVRMAVDHEYYPTKESKRIHRMHIDHCIDYLRQTVQCHSDLTPMVFSWSEDAGRVVADWREPHTCRNFSMVRAWAEERFRP